MAAIGEVSLRQLTGRELLGGGGWLDLLIGKNGLGHAIIRKLRDIGPDPSTINEMETWIGGRDACRDVVGHNAGEKSASWRAALRGARCDRAVQGALAGLGAKDQPGGEMPSNVIFSIFDVGVRRGGRKLGQPFQSEDEEAPKKDGRALLLQTTEEPVRDHRGNYSGVYG
ncbi:unnamed protein product, partial [Prorocentrum cordatum]